MFRGKPGGDTVVHVSLSMSLIRFTQFSDCDGCEAMFVNRLLAASIPHKLNFGKHKFFRPISFRRLHSTLQLRKQAQPQNRSRCQLHLLSCAVSHLHFSSQHSTISTHICTSLRRSSYRHISGTHEQVTYTRCTNFLHFWGFVVSAMCLHPSQ
jgi:hypothetical protein